MAQHELSVTNQHEADIVPAVPTQEVNESRQMTFNPDAVGTLTAEQDSAIEDMAADALANGMPVSEVQVMVYDKLSELGFDLSGVQHNALVVNYEGHDGKKGGLRVITLRPDDFGVVVHDAELVAQTPQVEQVSADEAVASKESASDTEQEDGRQDLLRGMISEVDQLQSSIEATGKDDAELNARAFHVTQVMRTEFIDKLTRGLPINMSLVHSTKLQARSLLDSLRAQRAAAHEQVGLATQPTDERFGDDKEQGSRVENAKSLAGQIYMNRRNREIAAQSAYNACGLLTNVLSQLEAGVPVAQLREMLEMQVSTIERDVTNGGSLNRELTARLNELKESLSAI